MNAVTSETLLNKVNESIEVLQDAQQTVVAAKEEIVAAPRIAQEANKTANSAMEKVEANETAIAELLKALALKADASELAKYLLLSGGTLTGSVNVQAKRPQIRFILTDDDFNVAPENTRGHPIIKMGKF